ncbi:phage baseplate assembly protein V [Enterobacteriaceae bacterium RIT711]|nr:phage baseplate assembly protein V [Enterobacteriaceae bacterium RIT711]
MVSADYTLADLSRRVSQMLRRGTIHSVQATPPRCRVSFGTDPLSGEEHKTDWLLWFAHADSERQDWSMPAVGAPALVLSVGGEPTGGIVFSGLLTDDQTPPSDNPNQHVTKYSDGATVMYDSSAHQATVSLPDGGKVTVEASGGILLKGDTTVDGNFIVTGDSTVDGNSDVGGDITAGGDIKDKGGASGSVQQIREMFDDHDHPENGDGGGTTSPPNQKMN